MMRRAALAILAISTLCACDCKDSKKNEPSATSLDAPESPSFGRAAESTFAEPAPRSRDSSFLGPANAPETVSDYEELGSPARAPGALFDGSVKLPEGPENVLATFRRRSGDPTPVAVKEVGGRGGPLVYDSGMTIDTDGRIRDPQERRRIASQDPHRQSDTSLHYADGSPLDPTRVPYIVVPKGFAGAQNGDLALVEYQGRRTFAIVGDRGPRNAIGEASIAVAQALGIDSHGGRGGVESGVRYTIFPGSAGNNPRNEAELLSFMTEAGPQVAAGQNTAEIAST